MDAEPLRLRYVAVMQAADGGRLFCASRLTDEWTGYFWRCESYGHLHVAEEVARRHGGIALPWCEASELAFEQEAQLAQHREAASAES